ncbi:MAG: hypothetical protein C4306_05210 [Thermoleophilia bacterium]
MCTTRACGVGERRWLEEEGHLGGLLHAPEAPREPKRPGRLQDAPKPRGCLLRGKAGKPGNGSLERGHLAQVDEAGKLSDGASEEGRSRAGTADDEDESLLGRGDEVGERPPAGEEPAGGADVQGGS